MGDGCAPNKGDAAPLRALPRWREKVPGRADEGNAPHLDGRSLPDEPSFGPSKRSGHPAAQRACFAGNAGSP